jgi:hypothetical protein
MKTVRSHSRQAIQIAGGGDKVSYEEEVPSVWVETQRKMLSLLLWGQPTPCGHPPLCRFQNVEMGKLSHNEFTQRPLDREVGVLWLQWDEPTEDSQT